MLNFRRPDPDYLASPRSQANFRLALGLAAAVVAVLWLVHGVNWALDYGLNRYGLVPRESARLAGILWAPLLHTGVAHLIANSVPLLVGLCGTLFVYPNAALRTLPAIYLGSGVLVWLFGRTANHIGASGLVYGLLAFILVSGVVKRDTRGIALSVLVWFLYGGMTRGMLPQGGTISWESHLAGAAVGVVMAIALRRWDRPPRKRYDWEDED